MVSTTVFTTFQKKSHQATPKDKDDPDLLMYGGERSVKAGLHLESRYPDRAHDDASSDHTKKSKDQSYKHTQAAIIQVLYRRKNCEQTNIRKAHQERWVSHRFCKEQHRLSKWSSPLCPDERSHIWPSSFQLDILGTPHILPPFLHVPLLLLSGPRR